MEDRYLFKAKRIDNGEWVKGALVYDNRDKLYRIITEIDYSTGTCLTTDNAPRVDKSTICQCTGLKDKNGKLIWENDVVKCVDENNDIEFTAIIEFGNPNGLYDWGYQLQHIKGDEPNLDILLWVDMEEAGATCKVIGNIFDNKELLESEEN